MKRLELLDYGRFFASLTVVAFHYTFNGIANGKIDSISHIPSVIEITKYGYLGVELFFMISGYVIFFSAKNRSAAMFAESRAIRLYPAYWFAILFTSFFSLQWGGSIMSVYPNQIIANFSLMQSFVGIGHIDGVYWTLVYEVTFYFAVFTLLFFGFQKHLNSIFIYWPVLFCFSIMFGFQSKPYLGGYYYYFSAGALFALLADKFDRRALFSLMVVYVLCVYFSVSKVDRLINTKGVEYSALVIGVIVTSFFVLLAYQNSKKGQLLSIPMSRLAGSLTYPIYLIHAHFGYMFISQFATEDNKFSIYLLTLFIVIIVSMFIHFIIEKKLAFLWDKIFYHIIRVPVNSVQKVGNKIYLGCYNRIN